MKVSQRATIQLHFELPDGTFKSHPALVVSNRNVLDTEDIFYAIMFSSKPYNDEFSFELKDNMLTNPLVKKSFVKCQLIQSYSLPEVISKISSVKQPYFDQILQRMFETVFQSAISR